ncbi:MAG TPA: hypothetical protein PLE19_09795 [Planctomycetota bacterium]|nr:hypothetical protein [Planctomycetota bacterium]HRR79205.1 hypothetical protein [Planctomycetota bacterium]HRT94230.1 hypothetical protein [Planctomycetota bacterium]
MTYRGHVENGVVVLDEPAPLAEGTRVRVEPDESGRELTLAERLKDVIGIVKGLPPDFAAQHDHYIHGTPKR